MTPIATVFRLTAYTLQLRVRHVRILLLHLIQLVTFTDESLDLPKHAIDSVIFFSYLQDLLVLEVIETITYSSAKFLGNFRLRLLPF